MVHNWIAPETETRNKEYLRLQLRADQKKRLYKREEYDILSYFGELGGLS